MIPSYPRIAIKCQNRRCRRVIAESDGATRLYISETGYIERTAGVLHVHCACGAVTPWHPRLDAGRILEAGIALIEEVVCDG